LTTAVNENSGSLDENGKALEKSEEEIKAEEAAVRALTQANQSQLSTLATLTGSINEYKDKEAGLKQEHDELLAKKNALIVEGWGAESTAILDVNSKLSENERAQQENTEAFVLATNTRILSRAEELLSADGLTTAEKDMLIERGIAMGVYTAEAAQRMKEEEQAANDLATSINNIPVEKTIDITTNMITNHIENWDIQGGTIGHAGGGDVNAGTLYKVNETRTEYFKPSMGGTIIPLGGGAGNDVGGNINITLSPMIMAGDRSQAENVLLPMIINGVRKARADKII
jgi:hypothetical protein